MSAAACRFQQAELVHGRTAMIGVAGILIPDVRPVPRRRHSAAPSPHIAWQHLALRQWEA